MFNPTKIVEASLEWSKKFSFGQKMVFLAFIFFSSVIIADKILSRSYHHMFWTKLEDTRTGHEAKLEEIRTDNEEFHKATLAAQKEATQVQKDLANRLLDFVTGSKITKREEPQHQVTVDSLEE